MPSKDALKGNSFRKPEDRLRWRTGYFFKQIFSYNEDT